MDKLGKLVKVNVRDIWEHEARDFSSWLVKDENLALLSEEIGLDIEPIGTEESSGRFRVDILAKEANSGDYVIIENQLEPTNHDHLGKVITYAAGYDAKYLIWIVKDVLDEHLKAVEWLNEHLDNSISCFLIKIEVWQIGDSKPAPRFEVVSIKNNWVANLKSTVASGELSPHQLNQQEFWRLLGEDFKLRDPNMRVQTPLPQHWLNFSLGSSLCHPYLTVNTKENFVSCDLWTTDKTFLAFLQSRETELKSELGYEFSWWEANKSGGIRTKYQVSDVFDPNEYKNSFNWLFEAVKKYQQVFPKYVREYKASNKV
jgi:hypothetical protein